MRHENEVRELLINNTIHLVSEGGFERATTKELAFCGGSLPDLKMNEVYIYRLFGSKESLYEQAFHCLDQELFRVLRAEAQDLDGFETDTREKLWRLFLAAWQYCVSNEERSRYYVQYYHSVYFKGRSREKHQKLFSVTIARLVPAFKEGADVTSILHSVFTTFFDFVVRAYNGELEDSEENREHIFNVLYCMTVTYLKDPKGGTLWLST